MIRRRCIFFIGGYDPTTPKDFFKRFVRETSRFETTWDVVTSFKPGSESSDKVGRTSISASKEGIWEVTTDFHFLSLDSIISRDFARPLPVRLWKYLAAFVDYVFSGTAFRMFVRGWRFGLYFLYPMLFIGAFLAFAYFAASLTLQLGRVSVPGLPALLAIIALWPFLATVGRRWSITHLMDLWSFSLNYLQGRRPDADALLDHFAHIVVDGTAATKFDEILLIGHSTGGGLILDIAARSQAIDPQFAGRSEEVSLLTLGSTALKFGLHPAAKDYRRKVQSLVDDPRLKWAEYQCMTDVINFYKSDPVIDMGLKPRAVNEKQSFPMIRQVHMRDCLDAPTYKRIRHNFFRVHYQFVLGNTRRYFYDFFMICLGPLPLSQTFAGDGNDPRVTGSEEP